MSCNKYLFDNFVLAIFTIHTSSVVWVKRVFAKDEDFPITTDKGACATVTRWCDNCLAFHTNHLLGFHSFHLSASLCCTHKSCDLNMLIASGRTQLNGCVHGSMTQWLYSRLNGWIHGSMFTAQWLYSRLYGFIHGSMAEFTAQWLCSRFNGWIHSSMAVFTVQWLYSQLNGCIQTLIAYNEQISYVICWSTITVIRL